MKFKRCALISVLFLPLIGLLNGCTTMNPYTGEAQISDATVGIGVGAASGALIGNLVSGHRGGTLIGAGMGALAGGVIGSSMDQQEMLLRQQLQNTGIRVARIGHDIRLIMPGDITFANDREDIRTEFYQTLNSVALVLNKFTKTTVKVAGYASSTGAAMHNQELSERRAKNVANYLAAQKVDPNRLMAVGYGMRNPIASNATAEGQALNRRVEVTIHSLAR